MVSNAVQSNISNTTIELSNFQLVSMNTSGVEIIAQFSVTNPSSHNATVDGKHLNVSIISSGVKVTYLGYFDLLNLNVAPGKNMFTKRIFISVSNEDTLKELGRLFLSEKQLKMRISGNVKVTVTDLFTPAETTVELEKDIILLTN